MLVQHTEEFSSLVVDVVEDIFVNTDRNSIIIIDEHRLNEIGDLDGVISLQIVRWMIPIDGKDVRRNLRERVKIVCLGGDFTLRIVEKM